MRPAMETILQATLLLVLTIIALQGTVILDLQRKLLVLRRQFLAERPPVNAQIAVVGSDLPPLDGISARLLLPVAWTDYLPQCTGLVIVLDPIEESCWFMAEEFATRGAKPLRVPSVVLLAAAPVDGERFLRKTGLGNDSRVVIIGPRSSTLKALGVSWRPAALAIRNGTVRGAVQVHDAKHLESWAEQIIPTNGGEANRIGPLGDPAQVSTLWGAKVW